ncbi:MAG: hypothetical protein PF689_09340 [Deltaproteobacteria bacterium]|jgi:hypothetical protein|nr:hypothetical protein [Deltaproteobacteria bacterium]
MKNLFVILIISMAFVFAGCDDDNDSSEQGVISIETWGEEFIEVGIPAEEFDDGWSITFDKFIVNLGQIHFNGQEFTTSYLVDLVQEGPHFLVDETTAVGAVEQFDYSLLIADGSSENVNLENEDVQLMEENNYSLYVSGSATLDGSTLVFNWGFSESANYVNCHVAGEIEKDQETAVQLTIHGDHLFYTSLVDSEAGLGFDAIANCDTDEDGEITREELFNFSGIDFSSLDNYDVPGGSSIDNMWDYLAVQVKTVGHIDGEGHCEME